MLSTKYICIGVLVFCAYCFFFFHLYLLGRRPMQDNTYVKFCSSIGGMLEHAFCFEMPVQAKRVTIGRLLTCALDSTSNG